MPLWQIGLIFVVILGRLGGPYLGELAMKAPQNWAIPTYGSLKVATGTYEPTYLESHGKGSLFLWGRMLKDDGSIFTFTCDPGVDEVGCAYSAPYNLDKNIGKRVSIRYFDWDNKNGPGNVGPRHVIMELRGAGEFYPDVVLSYRSSVDRLSDFREKLKQPSLIDIIFFGAILFALPGLIFRLVTGREAPSRGKENSSMATAPIER